MAAIQLRGIHKRFGETEVLRGIDLKLNSGEFVVFVGPSGCGKSTLLRILAGLEQPSDGEIVIDGKDATALRPTARGVAMVFQNYALYPHMTVADNIGFGLKIAGVPKAERLLAVEKAAAALRLTPLLSRKPAALSGGQRQRVAIGRAIVKQPKIFLFDEPLSNLDADLRGEMRLEIGRLHKSLSTTMVYVTHDQVEAMTLADKIVVLRDGSVEQVGTPDELYRSPANTFVARFLGSPKMNLVERNIVEYSEGRAIISLPTIGNIAIAPSVATKLMPGSEISVGFRAQHLTLAEPIGETAAEVLQVEHLGDVAHVHLACPGGRVIVASIAHGQVPASGDRVGLSLDGKHLLIFGPDGLRL